MTGQENRKRAGSKRGLTKFLLCRRKAADDDNRKNAPITAPVGYVAGMQKPSAYR
jgi:hypothetical protein